MSKYRKLAERALNERKEQPTKKPLTEGMLYEDGITERIHPALEEALKNGKHSLAECGIFPEGDEMSFEMKLIRERFAEVVKRCREAYGVDRINDEQIMAEQMPLVKQSMQLEGSHKKALEDLAVEMILEEFDIPEGSIDIVAELNPKINMDGTMRQAPEMMDETFEFEDADEISMANNEVKKRRALNAMIQGASKKLNHMFHMVHEQLAEMDPRLPGTYKRLMSGADYMYYKVPDLTGAKGGGKCEVEFNESEEGTPKPQIKATAMVFPVLVHELCKGVMEVLSAHGLPTKENIAEYVINKADYLEAEPWDMRLGPAMWGRFCEMMPDDSFELKHHVYTEMAALPPKEFNATMKEVLGKTKRGKEIMLEMVTDIKKELQEDDFNDKMGDDYFDIEDLF